MSNSFYLSVLLYVSTYMVNDLGQIRNGMSSGLVLLSVYYLHNNRKLGFLSLVLSATLIHFTAFLSLAILALKSVSRPLIMFCSLAISFLIAVVGGGGMRLVDITIGILGLGAEFRLVRYMSTQFAETYSIFGGTISLSLMTSIMVLAFRKRLISVNSYNIYFIPMYLYGTCLMLVFCDYGIVLARIKDLFCIPASMILLPSFIYIVKPRDRLLVLFGLFAYASLVFYIFLPEAPYRTLIFN